jgi:acetyltransferase-like isoleucine patch superfamily enzyme
MESGPAENTRPTEQAAVTMFKFRGLYTRFLNRKYRKALGHMGAGVIIHRRASIEGFIKQVRLGDKCWIRRDTLIECDQPTSTIEIGKDTLIGPAAMLFSSQGHIRVGDHCSINPFCVLYGQGNLTIGNWVRIAAHTVIVTSNHVFDDPHKPIKTQGLTKRGVTIEDDVWIGAGARILDGCRIGKGSVVGAGSVVTRSVDPYTIVVGAPARVIGTRGPKDEPPAEMVQESRIAEATSLLKAGDRS